MAELIEVPFGKDLGGTRNQVLDGGQDLPMARGNFEGRRASHCKVQGHSAVISAKSSEPTEMPFGLWARMGQRNRVRWESTGAEGRSYGKQFWDAICYNWLFGFRWAVGLVV